MCRFERVVGSLTTRELAFDIPARAPAGAGWRTPAVQRVHLLEATQPPGEVSAISAPFSRGPGKRLS